MCSGPAWQLLLWGKKPGYHEGLGCFIRRYLWLSQGGYSCLDIYLTRHLLRRWPRFYLPHIAAVRGTWTLFHLFFIPYLGQLQGVPNIGGCPGIRDKEKEVGLNLLCNLQTEATSDIPTSAHLPTWLSRPEGKCTKNITRNLQYHLLAHWALNCSSSV